MSRYDELYEVKIGPVEEVELSKLRIHPLNVPRLEPDRDAWIVFTQDIKERGIQVPLVITHDGRILQGQRRSLAARKVGFKTVPVRRIEPNPELLSLLKIIYRDNGETRRNYTDEELERIVLANFERERILQVLPRGATKNKSVNALLQPLETLLPQIAAISRGRAKIVLAALRKRLKEEDARKRLPDLVDGEVRFGLNRAREWQKSQKHIEALEKRIQSIRENEIDPARGSQKQIEKELRQLGGLERFLKMLEKKKKI